MYTVPQFNPFTPTDHFSLIQNNEWKIPLKLLSVARVNQLMVNLKWFNNTTTCD